MHDGTIIPHGEKLANGDLSDSGATFSLSKFQLGSDVGRDSKNSSLSNSSQLLSQNGVKSSFLDERAAKNWPNQITGGATTLNVALGDQSSLPFLAAGATLVLTVLSVCIQLVVVFKFNLGIYIILRDMASCCLQAFSLAVCAAVCIRKLEEPSGRRRRSRTGATSRQLGTFFQ